MRQIGIVGVFLCRFAAQTRTQLVTSPLPPALLVSEIEVLSHVTNHHKRTRHELATYVHNNSFEKLHMVDVLSSLENITLLRLTITLAIKIVTGLIRKQERQIELLLSVFKHALLDP